MVEFRERFLTEMRLAASLDHPHVCPVYRAGEEDGVLYLALRYVPGEDLGSSLGLDRAARACRERSRCWPISRGRSMRRTPMGCCIGT